MRMPKSKHTAIAFSVIVVRNVHSVIKRILGNISILTEGLKNEFNLRPHSPRKREMSLAMYESAIRTAAQRAQSGFVEFTSCSAKPNAYCSK